MSKQAKLGFFFLALLIVAILAGGSLVMVTNLGLGLLMGGAGCLLVVLGFAVKRRLVRQDA